MIAAERAAHIADLTAAHAARFPWYAELLRRHGVAAGAALPELPLIDHDLLDEHYYRAPVPAGCHAFHTSGTATGRRKRIAYDAADERAYAGHRLDLFRRFTVDLPPGSTAVADLGTGHAAATAKAVFGELGLVATDIDFQAPLDQHVAVLNDTRPDLLFTMPMILERLLHAEPPLVARPRKIAVVGDVAPAAWRQAVAAHVGIDPSDVLDVFGSIEIGAIAHSEASSGRYRFHDHIVAEVLDPSTGTVRDSGDGVLVLTSLARRCFPGLRYVTGDLVSGLSTVVDDDGVARTTMTRIDGRVSGDVKHGERISAHDISSAVATVFPGRAFGVSGERALVIHVAVDTLADRQRDALVDALLARVPDVATMVRAGLVEPVRVVAAGSDMPVRPKRHIEPAAR